MQKGDRVRLLNVGGVIATVLAPADRDGGVQVQAGPMKMTVKENEVRLVEEKKAAAKPKQDAAEKRCAETRTQHPLGGKRG